MASTRHYVFLTGGTGFMGGSLAKQLLRRGHRVRALVRAGSESKLTPGCEPVRGDALSAESYASQIAPADTFVHLVGVAHPNPRKAAEFRAIDLKSCQEAVHAAVGAGVRHFVYLSVARPAPIMLEYQAVRAEGERLIRESGMAATFVRPWYVLGPGRRWPYALIPLYALARLLPATSEGAQRLALVTLQQITEALAWAVENPPETIQTIEPPQMRVGFAAQASERVTVVSA
jgi:uncharacterized protein YbjT (DUF2867 family)